MTDIAPYSGRTWDYDLAIGSVFGVRWFSVDSHGRLTGPQTSSMWKPGENVARCSSLRLYGSLSYSVSLFGSSLPELSTPEPTKAEKHETPADNCACGFYAYALGCDDKQYALKDGPFRRDKARRVYAVVEAYGRVMLGTKGFRAEKARIVAVHDPRRLVNAQAYPEVERFRSRRAMHATFNIVRPVVVTPADPEFWTLP